MIPIFKANIINAIDNYTILNEPISSFNLMDRAASKCYEEINKIIDISFNGTIHVFCGLGNNGGDGLVIARKLFQSGRNVKIYTIFWGQKKSRDFVKNERIIEDLNLELKVIDNSFFSPSIEEKDYIIDAIWGTGLSRPIENFVSEIIRKINQINSYVISIDIPSGLGVEPIFPIEKNKIINADITLTFEFPKLSFLLPETGNYVGQFKIISIGLNKTFIKKQKTNQYYLNENFVKRIFKKRKKFSHKGDFGHSLLVSGSIGKIGASILSSKACLKSGAGLLTVHIPKCGYDIIQKSVPEAMAIKDIGSNYLESFIDLNKYSSIGVGPGIESKKKTYKILNYLFESFNNPMVIDADAINIISKNRDLIKKIPKNSILTPHLGEFRRLVGNWTNDVERQEKLVIFSKKYNLYIILKGAYTSISCPSGEIIYNSTGNPGMATAGSGDVLTGILTGLLSQKYNSKEASLLGTYIHGLSGDLAKNEIGEVSLNASNIIDYISKAFQSFYT